MYENFLYILSDFTLYGMCMNFATHTYFDGNLNLQPTQLFSRFACLYPREYKCSKLWNSNFINNWTLLILFYYFTIVGIYRCVGSMDAPLKNVFTTSLGITYTTRHLQGMKQTVCLR